MKGTGWAARLASVLVLLVLVALALAQVATAAEEGEEAPVYTAGEEYGMVPGESFAEAHAPVTFYGVQSMAAMRKTILSAPRISQAGAHPDVTAAFSLRPIPGKMWPLTTKDILVDAPPGLVGNATAVPACSFTDFMRGGNGQCSPVSQVGVTWTNIATEPIGGGPPGFIGSKGPVYLLQRPADAPARFGFRTAGGEAFVLTAHVRSDGDYGLRMSATNLITNAGIMETITTLWGVPYDPVHNPDRVDFRPGAGPIVVPEQKTVLISNPTYCDSGPLPTTIWARSWKWLTWATETVFSEPAPSGCDKLEFGGVKAPVSLTMQPDKHEAVAPVGLFSHLTLPYNEDPNGLARPTLRETKVELPVGVTLNAAAAGGLQACTEEQIGIHSLEPARCPDASKIASVQVKTPVLSEPLGGAIYLAEQERNPFGSTMAIYLSVAGQGVQAKIPGLVERDAQTGQVTATFSDTPQLPFTDMNIQFKQGDRAAVVLPSTCGMFTTRTTLTPWSYPYTGPPVVSTDSFNVDRGPEGGACVQDRAQLSFKPVVTAGVANPVAGTSSTFAMRVTRGDADRELTRMEVQLPKGLTGRLAGVPYCSEQAIGRAISRNAPGQGRDELADPSCPAQSRVGSAEVGVGAGSTPYYAGGAIYLAGPYKGAPLSLVVVVPAVAGPFDLGVQVVRAAVRVDPTTAQVTASSDEIPRMLDGVPLRVRDVHIDVDRPNFMRAPTNCEPAAVNALIEGESGGMANDANRFQVGDCGSLAFEPRLNIQLKGATKRIGHPALTAVVTAKPGEANIASAQVNLPRGEFLDQGNLNKICTKPVLLEGKCPASSVYGHAKAWTPLLDKPLEGDVYLVGGYGYKLPALVAELNGQIKVLLVGKVDSGKNKGIRNTFELIPDAPVEKFELRMKGGKKYGLLENSENLCKAPKAKRRANVRFTGQNGMVEAFKPIVQNQCGKGKKAKKHTKTQIRHGRVSLGPTGLLHRVRSAW
jgi:hypothetical protein